MREALSLRAAFDYYSKKGEGWTYLLVSSSKRTGRAFANSLKEEGGG